MQRKLEILHRYWFEFEKPDSPGSDKDFALVSWPPFGCGVTAYDYDDAMALMKQLVFTDDPLPKITSVVQNVDMNVLLNENNHIGPYCSCAAWRGIWWPKASNSGPVIGSVSNKW
jgi:hypothetical protein